MNRELYEALRNDAPYNVIRSMIESKPNLALERYGGPRSGMYPLHFACSYNRSKDVLLLLLDYNPASIHETGIHGQSSLHALISNDRGPPLENVRLLLERAPELITMADSRGWTPLHYAYRYRAPLDVIQYLIEKHPSKACLKEKSRDGLTPLHLACRYATSDDVHVVQDFLEMDGPLGLFDTDVHGQTPLLYSIRYGAPLPVIEFLVRRMRCHTPTARANNAAADWAWVHFTDTLNQALHYSIRYGSCIGTVRLFLQHFDSFEAAKSRTDQATPLHTSCRYNADDAVVKFLLEEYHPEALYETDKWGQTPLHTACRYGANESLIRLLFHHHHNHTSTAETTDSSGMHFSPLTRSVDLLGRTPLHWACTATTNTTPTTTKTSSLSLFKKRAAEIVAVLLEKDPGAAMVQDTAEGLTCLHLACRSIIENSDYNDMNHHNNYEILRHDLNVVKAIVQAEPDLLKTKNHKGQVPLHYTLSMAIGKNDKPHNHQLAAQESASFSLVQYLVSKDAYGITAADNTGRNALHAAYQAKVCPSTMHLLISANPVTVVEWAYSLMKQVKKSPAALSA